MKNKTNNILQIIQASEHNLKNIDVSIPHNSLTVITGVSGSGKSSLAYSVIFKESQRRFLESFSSYSRQYLGKMEKPKVKEITGLQAALAIHQNTAVANPRSTVGTMSGIYDYLRLLFARMGEVFCADCGHSLERDMQNCPSCGLEIPEIQAKLFSFNSKYGACPTCIGLGITEQIDPNKLIADETKSIAEGALVPTTPNGYIVYSQVRVDELEKVCQAHGFSVNIPWNELSEEQQNVIWYGSERVKILFGKHSLESRLKWKGITAKPREEAYYKGMLPIMEEILKRDRNDNILRFASSFGCKDCEGSRIRKEARSVKIQGNNIAQLSTLSLSDLQKQLIEIGEKIADQDIYENILNHVFKRLEYLQLLGLEYLTLSRESTTLSGGEAQRIRLASQVGSGLQGILYILDEPSIGLHSRDNQKLLKVLKTLRNQGNTVVVVEHDEETIKNADYLIDIGPKAGIHGGEVIFQGKAADLLKNKAQYPLSLTASAIANDHADFLLNTSRKSNDWINIKEAKKNNLKNISVEFKLFAFNVVTGVSGAGKSTLVHQVLCDYFKKGQKKNQNIESTFPIERLIEIDQSPIGRTPRSNPATYTDLFNHIRDLFASLPESKNRGYQKGRFSFNNVGGRCEHCQGAGTIQLGMHFLGDVEIVCEHCDGKRFNEETLEIKIQEKNIFDVLELSIVEAREFFDGKIKITKILDQLIKLDVGYLKLGQPSTTLSGGEAQRVKLASELYKSSKGHTLYILDEPSVGLHKADIQYLLEALNEIVDKGNTVIVIEHDLDIIKQADHVVDLGPEGGEKGGYIVAHGTISDLINCETSHTGKALKQFQEKKEISAEENMTIASNIKFSGVTTHNLKNIDVEIPLNKTTVITGVSGSGKTSLAFDTIYSESRNRFTENLSTYARRMMSKVKKPEMEQCSGLTPAIAIRQDRFKKNPRSTVGTVTEIYDSYRLLYSRAGIDKNHETCQLAASMFSFNKVEAACEHCKGMGIIITADPDKFISNSELSIVQGAMDGNAPGKYFGDINGQFVHTLLKVGNELGMDFTKAFRELTYEEKNIALYGTEEREYEVQWVFKRGNRTGTHQLKTVWKGFVNLLNEEYEIKRDGKRGEAYLGIMSEIDCPSCKGQRLKKEALDISFNQLSISELSAKSISQAISFFENIESQISKEIFARCQNICLQIVSKLKPLAELGLGYLSIDRTTQSLSSGEAQRLRIASQLVSDLCGLTYVLDEPTIGLHPRDNENLWRSINRLQQNGNSIIMVEHDPDMIAKADYIIDMGPGAGNLGGEVIAQGDLATIRNSALSITGKYIREGFPKFENQAQLKARISIKRACKNNLKNIDLKIPSGGLVTITGVSGSGKTSLVFETIAKSFQQDQAVFCQEINFQNIEAISIVNQESIGTSPLSTCATYTGIFDEIRELFAKEKEAKTKGFKKSHFSFNSSDGRCDSCKGMGQTKVSMDFLSDIWVTCDVCHGKRYQDKILSVKHLEHSIYDILNLNISEAISIFKNQSNIANPLQVLEEVGLGYISLGQSTSTLSGGELQRLKLAKELMNKSSKKTLFLIDEPTNGLHLQDVERLLNVFGKLIKQGHSIIAVEHHLEIIKAADWIVDLGPEGGDEGGELIYSGPMSEFLKCENSATSLALKNSQ